MYNIDIIPCDGSCSTVFKTVDNQAISLLSGGFGGVAIPPDKLTQLLYENTIWNSNLVNEIIVSTHKQVLGSISIDHNAFGSMMPCNTCQYGK